MFLPICTIFFVDLSNPETERGFFRHIQDPWRFIRTGWTERMDYDIELEMKRYKEDLAWRLQLYYDQIVRLFTVAKNFGVGMIQLQFQKVAFHNIPGLESRAFEAIPVNWAQLPPHSLVFGLINVIFY